MALKELEVDHCSKEHGLFPDALAMMLHSKEYDLFPDVLAVPPRSK
jgi:hypothetical protein